MGKLSEFGIVCEFPEQFKAKLGNQWHTSTKLSSVRTLSTLALSQLIQELQGIGMTALLCTEAIPGLGIAGISWKKHFQEKVNVVVNALDDNAGDSIISNSKLNSLEPDHSFKVVKEEPNAHLHSGGPFNFIYLEAYGNCMRYLESACHVITHKGILCVVSTDLSTLYNKSPERVRRIYHGYTMKNEYMKELAVRLILANVARAASRWDRGVSVLVSYADDNCVVVFVRVLKGASHADVSLDLVKKIAHCRECHFRCVRNEKLHYVPQPDMTNCFCKENGALSEDIHPPIVMLGPIYTGPIFDTMFLYGMREFLSKLDPVHEHLSLLQNMLTESLCLSCDKDEAKFLQILSGKLNNNIESQKDSDEPPTKRLKGSDLKSFVEKHSKPEFPMLFALAQTHVMKGYNPPKLVKVIQKLRSEGYQACRTIFDPRGIRTSASLQEFRKFICAISTETP